MENLSFEVVLKSAGSLPGVKIDREKFLNAELKKYCIPEVVEMAIQTSPSHAKIPSQLINTVARNSIVYETNKVSAISFVSGLPGGIAMIGTVPADIAQYFGHILRILQKLAYLYDWEDLFDTETGMDDETESLLTIFVGIMFGVSGAAGALTKIAQSAGDQTYKVLMTKALTKGTIYPIVKKISKTLGIKMTKEIFAKQAAKVVLVLGGVVSGGLTYATYRPMAFRLHKYLMELNRERDERETTEMELEKTV